MSDDRFRGVFAIPVTPFAPDGSADHAGLERVVRFSLDAGAHGVVVPVNVSEFTTLTDEERSAVVATTVAVCAGRVPVVAGVSAPSAVQAAGFARRAADVGADAVIAVPPYVRRAAWSELVEYFAAIAGASGLPVFVQNADGPAGTPLSSAQVLELARTVTSVTWLKEETAASSRIITEVLASDGPLEGVMGGKGARFLLDEYPRGVCGTMPGCEFTDLHVALWHALEAGDRPLADRLHRRLLPLVSMEDQYGGARFCKAVLRERGILEHVVVREVGSPDLDDVATQLLRRLLDDALGLLASLGAPPLGSRPA